MKKKTKEINHFHTREIKKKNYMNDDYKMALSFIGVLFIVLALVGLLFFFNGKFVTKDEFQGDKTTATTEPSYDDTVILVNDILDISDKKYYVLAYDFTNIAQNSIYTPLVNSYSDSDIKLYSVNLGISFNKKYYNQDKEESVLVNNYKNFNFTRPTLLVVNKHKVEQVLTDNEKITNMLRNKKEA